MIRVGFFLSLSKNWMGGVNYYKNLFYALNKYTKKDLELIVFFSNDQEREYAKLIEPYVSEIIYTSMLDHKNIKRFIWKFSNKYLHSNIIIEDFLKKNKIDVLSHTPGVYHLKNIRTIAWIPDFLHLHLPDMFIKKEIDLRNISYDKLIRYSDLTIVSSYDAMKDLSLFRPEMSYKARVLQFVSQPEKTDLNENIHEKYNLKKNFFYLPNQFWKHKNHMVVFEAVKILKNKNIDIQVVCTGNLNDLKNKDHIDELISFINLNKLENNIIMLNLIPYSDVFSLMKFSKAVVNPSKFEGWSSSVEECKSMGKQMILSDIAVHKEQFPEALFFDKFSSESLAKKFQEFDNNKENTIDNLEERTKKFAENYLDLIHLVLKNEKLSHNE